MSSLARNAQRFGKVAVLYGGTSAEREVSLASGEAVLGALRAAGVDAHGIDKDARVLDRLRDGGFERAFIILHGRGGEDGTIQGALDTIGMPYTGSGVAGCALAMDKHRTKLVWRALGIPTPEFHIVRDEADLAAAIAAVGFPAFVKPVHEGSSVGMAPAHDEESLHRAWFDAAVYDREVLVERHIDGLEYTVSILGREVLPIIRLQPARSFYDYEAKYADDAGTLYHCPCGLDRAAEARLAQLSLAAFDAVGAAGWGRLDLLCDASGNPYFIDVNTAPGMTSHSLVPMAAAAAGLSFEQLVVRILEEST
jgi:D-alanine-D-alanine ligase